MLATRLATGTTLVVVLVAILILDEWFAPWFPLWFATSCLVMTLCALEVVSLLAAGGNKAATSVVVGGVLALVAANWIPHLIDPFLGESIHRASADPPDPSSRATVLAWPLWAFVAVLMGTFVVEAIRFRQPGGTMTTVAATVLTVAYVGLLGSFIIQLRWFHGLGTGLLPLAYLVASAKGSDIGAYSVGRLVGRHKLWPTLSPNKTVEGALGGVLAGVLGALAVAGLSRLVLGGGHFGLRMTILFGAVVAVAAQVGDLMESLIKRDADRKDASSAVPGFGGVLDVLDSLLFAAPVAYGLWVWANP